MNISSIVVRTLPENLEAVTAALEASDQCEVHFHDELGNIVVTVEKDAQGDETQKLKAILGFPQVISADFSYIYSDDEDDAS